ncbi:hypothetical protein [Endozoicomonas arenosclerae]|uniref:hypothetical protein n=1 Tax=Endozoicomonas arenosclerae TaxID=1633495 RepID=UPI000783065D|nr:hypothetical protein [Endozoicomonas arenosclerae]
MDLSIDSTTSSNFYSLPNGQVPVDESSATLGQYSVGSRGPDKSLTSEQDDFEIESAPKRSLCARIAHPLTSTVSGIYNKTVTTALRAESAGYEKGGFLLGKPMKIIGGLCGLGYGVLTSLPMFAQGVARAYQGDFGAYDRSVEYTGLEQNYYRKSITLSQLNATKPLWFKGSVGSAIEKMRDFGDRQKFPVSGTTNLDFMLNFYLHCINGRLDLNAIVEGNPELKNPLMVLLKAVEDETQVYQLIDACHLTGDPDVQDWVVGTEEVHVEGYKEPFIEEIKSRNVSFVRNVHEGATNLDSDKIRPLRQALKKM